MLPRQTLLYSIAPADCGNAAQQNYGENVRHAHSSKQSDPCEDGSTCGSAILTQGLASRIGTSPLGVVHGVASDVVSDAAHDEAADAALDEASCGASDAVHDEAAYAA